MIVRDLTPREVAERRFLPIHSPLLWDTRGDFDDTNGEVLVIELELGFRVVEALEVQN